ncbi:hypothetical protein KI387_036719, partial [Taxus chinensis]
NMSKNAPDQRFGWGEIISDTISQKLQQVLTTGKFYINSYVVYAATSERDFAGLARNG